MGVTNIYMAGVGGQGLVLTTEIVVEVAFLEGYEVKSNDVIGLSQRGGKVWGSVRFGEKVYSALIPEGEGDLLLAMEELEGLRLSSALKKGAKIIFNEEIIFPNKVLIEKDEYPENIREKLVEKGYEVISLNAQELAKDLGNIKTANIVLLGKLSKYLPFKEETWLKVIENKVPAKTVQVNFSAFKAGRQA
ncbi:indolepyruvate oxidoreductase subunit beta [Clostridium sp. FP1]|uniref:indolepyruvate oxidoreductase subunit beta n=1 Tax=Clostridium sp. FP1 TaxID=2724076 RepID=UPI0013E91003|nr:indolepyruvate oxidoreductase subunit beta [Clostridium sp. FP1]MBZ9635663.1 indolepyruvate oxidoreductase subunit beta [Clostridium sp. FP1]